MLKLIVGVPELYDDVRNEFIPFRAYEIQLEHSLLSLSKWESKWKKPFLSSQDKSMDEVLDYVKCMTMTQNIPNHVYNYITDSQYSDIIEYIHDEKTATKVVLPKTTGRKETVTSELIYYWMITYNIPWECQKWHLSRLTALINICNVKNSPPKKMSKQEIARRNADLNAMRKQSLGTKG